MTFSEEEVRHQIRLGEDSCREFKRIKLAGGRLTSPRRDDLADEIAALANARGGLLLCGVTDQGKIQGLSRDEATRLDTIVVGVSSDAIKPAVRIHTYHVELDGQLLVVVEVPQGESQHDSPGGSYVRVGGSKREMTTDERLRLALRRGRARFRSFDEQTVPGTGFQTLNESLWKPLLSVESAANPEAALHKMALLADDEAGVTRATVAGVLLCTQSPQQWLPGAAITATCYRGTDRASGQVDGRNVTGPVNRQIAEALDFARRNMQVAARKAPARVDLPQYSDKVLFEAVVNAVVHRDYSIRASKIRLSMFADRLEIQSPGSLPNNLTIESMAARQATRNEALASVLGRMPVRGVRGSQDRLYFMERRGDGVSIIRRETMDLVGRPPRFRLIDEAELCLTIPSAIQDPSPARTVITIRNAGQPLPDADVLVLFPNKTWMRSVSDEHGEAHLRLHTTQLPMTVFVGAPGYAAHVEPKWRPDRGALAVELARLPRGGAVVLAEATGRVPGLRGRLNPILDSHERCYLYASNIAINEGLPQPVHFIPGEEMRLTDAEGNQLAIRVVHITGRSALVEYRPC